MEEENSESFNLRVGQLIRHYRQLRGVSQVKLGHELGISFQQIQKYERAQNRVSIATFNQIRKN